MTLLDDLIENKEKIKEFGWQLEVLEKNCLLFQKIKDNQCAKVKLYKIKDLYLIVGDIYEKSEILKRYGKKVSGEWEARRALSLLLSFCDYRLGEETLGILL